MGCMEALEILGVDVNEGMDRVMGDKELYEMMLGMFVEMIEESPLEPADFDNGDRDELIKQVHVLKGTTGNLSIVPLFEGYSKALGLLRDGKTKDAKTVYEKMLPVQRKIIDYIRQHGNSAQ